jgi:hypothetical protein
MNNVKGDFSMNKTEFKTVVKELAALRWSKERINAYFENLPWLVGCNYIPANAINQLEMFQADSFDPARIDLELGWVEGLGFNTLRVYLHYLLWEQDRDGFIGRLQQFLGICEKHKMKVLLVLFDDCWNQEPAIGKQPEPKPSVHNSGWAASPGRHRVLEGKYHSQVLAYVKDILNAFKGDTRIWGWDLYNEPGNSNMGLDTLPLLIKTFRTARAVDPTQPISAGIWIWNKSKWKMKRVWKIFYELQYNVSDFISFHNYSDQKSLSTQISAMKKADRPVVCTEYMSRPSSRFETHLPIFKQAGVHAINWGLVDGKTQTKFKWGTPEGAPEPELWFHEIFHFDGTPYIAKEVEFIRKILKP